ncbi:MAG TPA: serine/threonine-protein kinase [Gemmataceae bacterium]|nr:serine/threonine-protein kinase [Gemmataceae bacterium]
MTFEARAAMLQKIGDYEILEKIAEGGMGAVYKARHQVTGDLVAIKVLPPTTYRNPILLRRFEQEYRAAAAIDHPNVVRAIDFCANGPAPFLVMEFVDGESLGAKVDRNGPMTEDAAIRVIAQVCQGLHKAHKQHMVHRDVKPDNILVTQDGVAKLTDLGLVKDADNEMNLTKTGRGLGTPNFMAPEQFRDAKNADIRCDIYSLGATLYCLLTGETPFGKVGPLECWMRKQNNELTAPREINPAVSERVEWAIQRAMSGNPEHRPASCKEFVEDLTGVTIRSQTKPGTDAAAPPADLWYLVYRDEYGETHTVKGTTDGIRRALKEGLLGDASNVRADRSKQGHFHTLISHPEFRDLVIRAAPAPTGPKTSGQMMRQTVGASRRTPSAPMTRPDPDAVDFTPAPAPIPANAYDPTQDYRPVGESTARPLIPVSVGHSGSGGSAKKKHVDWLLWAGVLVVALITSIAAVFLLPLLRL